MKLASKFYFLVKEAAPLSEIIESLNLEPEILEFLDAIPHDKKGFYIVELRKNPSINLEELKNLQLKERIKPQILPEELRIVGQDFPNKEWAFIQLRKLRQNKIPPKEVFFYIFADTSVDLPQEFETYANFALMYLMPPSHLLKDWIEAENPQLASYTAEQAMQASDEWHRQIAQKGSAQKYEERTLNIVYGPNWQNPKFNGWTIRKITTKNDLEVEGYKMNHCVGSYCKYVDLGQSTIYSLRDPSNEPHVTMETKGNSFQFEQIMGHSNSDPKFQYKEMIKEWFQNLKKQGKSVSYSHSSLNEWGLSSDWNKAKKEIANAMNENEYGVESNFVQNLNMPDSYAKFLHYANSTRSETYEVAEKLSEIIHEKDKFLYKKAINNLHKAETIWFGQSGIRTVLKMSRKFEEQFTDKYYEWLSHFDIPSEPNIKDYDGPNDEDYIDAIDRWKKQIENLEKNMEAEVRNNYPYNFDTALREELKKYQVIDPIPTESWMGEYNYNNL